MDAQYIVNKMIHPPIPSIDIKKALGTLWYRLGCVLVDLLSNLMFIMDVRYLAPIPSGAKILAANHPSTIDPIILITLIAEQLFILINEILFKVPIVGASLRFTEHIRVDLNNGKASLDEGVRYLKSGRTIGIFPEGIISPEGGLHRFRTGVARLAINSGAPVIPVGIYLDPKRLHRINSRVKGNDETGTWYIRGPYAITVGEPMVFHGDAEDHEYVRSVSAQIQQRVAILTQESARRVHAAQSRTSVTDTMVWLFRTARDGCLWGYRFIRSLIYEGIS